MDLYGLLGYPLGHSFSARYFADKFEREGIDATYQNFEYGSIEEAMAYLMSQSSLAGFNVTIPYKEKVLEYLSALSPEAEAIGAVNVVRVEKSPGDGKSRLVGYNSDVIGFVDSIRPLLSPHHTSALVLGTGGASKAVVYGLESMGIRSVYVSRKRTEDRLTYADLTPNVMNEYKVIVNCSPVGMFPHTGECPAIPYDLLSPEHLLYDLVYNPEETLFMKKGKECGATVKNGLEMLHLQAEAAWEIWNARND